MKKVKYNGRILECLSITELATETKRSVSAIRKLEERHVLPPANLRGKSKLKPNGDKIPGQRLYTKQLVQTLVKILIEISRGTKVTPKIQQQINNAFLDEKSLINTKA